MLGKLKKATGLTSPTAEAEQAWKRAQEDTSAAQAVVEGRREELEQAARRLAAAQAERKDKAEADDATLDRLDSQIREAKIAIARATDRLDISEQRLVEAKRVEDDNPKNKARFSLDVYGLMVNVRNLGNFLQQSLYWYSLFSHKRSNHDWKGFAAVPLNAADDQAALAAIAGGP